MISDWMVEPEIEARMRLRRIEALRQVTLAICPNNWKKPPSPRIILTHAVVQASRESLLDQARRKIADESGSAPAWENLGSLLVDQGQLEEACRCFETAILINPNLLSALNNLGVCLQHMGRFQEAENRYRQSANLAPDSVQIQLNLANVMGALGRNAEALQIVLQIVSREPLHVPALLLGYDIESSVGHYDAAFILLERAAIIAPHNADILRFKAELLCRLSRWNDALELCDRLPQDARTLHARARALKGLDRPDDALEVFQAAEEAAHFQNAAVTSDRAWLLAELGRKEEALAAFDQALRIQPDLTSALCHRAHLRRSLTNEDVVAMKRILEKPNGNAEDRINVSFSLGQAFLKSGDGEQAFQYLNLGNRLKRDTIRYDGRAEERRVDEIIATFNAENLSNLAGGGNASLQPIFVFGMPRSGTTLVEQILSSHPAVHGTGEPTHLFDVVQESKLLPRMPNVLPEELSRLGARYLDLIRGNAPGETRIVDKMTWNFFYAGLISLVLPNAKMILCRRDPLDTCLSCYSLQFTTGHPYAYDLDELGHFYRLYQRLTDHWRNVISPDRLIEVDYESVVTDTEPQVRRLLDFCGLPWDPACLRFHETDRRVTSASLDQVRSPIYKSSVGRAQAFLPWLAPLEAALADQYPLAA
jgi:tetratricopeptide (TPR) repeat protein